MRQVYASESVFQLNIIKQFLEHHDIVSFIKGEHLQGAYTGMQFSWAELMVLDEDFEQAKKLIEEYDLD